MTDEIVYRPCEPGDLADVALLLRQLQEHATAAALPDEARVATLFTEMAARGFDQEFVPLGMDLSHCAG